MPIRMKTEHEEDKEKARVVPLHAYHRLAAELSRVQDELEKSLAEARNVKREEILFAGGIPKLSIKEAPDVSQVKHMHTVRERDYWKERHEALNRRVEGAKKVLCAEKETGPPENSDNSETGLDPFHKPTQPKLVPTTPESSRRGSSYTPMTDLAPVGRAHAVRAPVSQEQRVPVSTVPTRTAPPKPQPITADPSPTASAPRGLKRNMRRTVYVDLGPRGQPREGKRRRTDPAGPQKRGRTRQDGGKRPRGKY